MNKAQLVDAVSAAEDLPKAKTASIIDAVFNNLRATLCAGEQFAFPGIGTFVVKKRAARVGRNPRTGGDLQIPAATVVGFKAAKALKDAVNTGTK